MSGKSKVAFARCASYEPDEIAAAVKSALKPLGGIRKFVRAGQRVLLKPNLLMPKPPEAAVTTHPALVAAAINLVKSVGATPVVGDSPGLITAGIDNVWRETGMTEVCEAAGVELVSFEAAGVERFEVGGRTVHVSKAVAHADVVISLPKLKTHTITLLTCAVKNLYGTLPGMSKADWHARLPKPSRFQGLLVDVLDAVRPALSIVDAVVGMDGDGPSGGSPKTLGFVAASADAVALDAECARIVGFAPERIDYLRLAAERGLGAIEPRCIQTLGIAPAKLHPDSFQPPRSHLIRFVPEFMLNLVRPLVWVRPGFGPECRKCGKCIDKCPAGALVMGEQCPVLDTKKCIECFCCHEICPHSAVTLELSAIARLFAK